MFGGIEILVNNEVAAHAPLADTTEDYIDWMVRVNVRGTIDVTRDILAVHDGAGLWEGA